MCVRYQLVLSCLTLFIVSTPLSASASDPARQGQGHNHSHGHSHGAHAHGKGELELLVDGNTVRGVFRTPMDSLLGFEHQPKTDAQKNAVDTLRTRLQNPINLIAPNPEAQCTPQSQEAISTMFSGAVRGGHSDLEYRFSFDCAQAPRLTSINIAALQNFKRLTEVRVQLVTPTAQRALVVRKRDPRVVLSAR